MGTIDLARAKELLDYDTETGVFTWKVTRGSVSVGSIAGRITHKGYITIQIESKFVKAHRLAWLYIYGIMPDEQIDHINGVRNDNRISNLRLATPAENQQNQRAAHSRNTTGYLGVSKVGNHFKARIVSGGRCINLGSFSDPIAAHSAYVAAKRELHPHGQL